VCVYIYIYVSMGMDGFCCDESMIGRVYIHTQQPPLAFVMTVEAFVITVDCKAARGQLGNW